MRRRKLIIISLSIKNMFLIFKFLKTLLPSFCFLKHSYCLRFLLKLKMVALKWGILKLFQSKLFLRFAIFKGIFKGRAPTDVEQRNP
jgi:hypothetical protein